MQEGIIDVEMSEVSPHIKREVEGIVKNTFPLNSVPHSELQEIAKGAKAIIRTGEFTPYSNIVLITGVLF